MGLEDSMAGRKRPRVWPALLGAALLGGCAMLGEPRHHASSVVDYLYSGRVGEVEVPGVPVLRLPLRVGIAFVPTSYADVRRGISEKKRIELMRQIAPHFEALEFVESIEIIPTAYLRPHGGFTNLDQLRTMFGIDVIALLSYDQIQFTGEGFSSISYWTLVGAYAVRGEKNDTHTMIDAAVYDVASRKLLFRAPGVSQIRGRATPVGWEEQLRLDRERGFEEAAGDLVPALQAALEAFQEDVRAQRSQAEVVHREGYVGGGCADWLLLAAIATLALTVGGPCGRPTP